MKLLTCLYIIAFTLLFGCEKSVDSASAANGGAGGSMARFTIAGNYLYAVSSHYLYAVDISNPAKPVTKNQSLFSFDIETIYPYKNRLFVGTRTGIYIYSIDDPAAPKLIGEARHGRSCDPVIANDTVSYSTLKGSSVCGPATSGLYVYDVKNLSTPVLKNTITINEPLGLGMADSALYVCAAAEGIKVYSVKNAYDPQLKQTLTGGHFIDLIPYGDILICWVTEGIRLYDISNRLQPVFLKLVPNS